MGTVRNVNYLPIFTFTTFCTVLMLIVTTKIELMLMFLQVHYVNVCFLSAHLVCQSDVKCGHVLGIVILG